MNKKIEQLSKKIGVNLKYYILDVGGNFGNITGGLAIKTNRTFTKFYWSIENYDQHNWKEIPEYLFINLLKYETERRLNQQ